MIEITLFNSHFYRGARGRIAPDWADGDAVVSFSDGARAQALLLGEVLHVFPHRTNSGTQVAAKSWRLRPSRLGFRVVSRVTPA